MYLAGIDTTQHRVVHTPCQPPLRDASWKCNKCMQAVVPGCHWSMLPCCNIVFCRALRLHQQLCQTTHKYSGCNKSVGVLVVDVLGSVIWQRTRRRVVDHGPRLTDTLRALAFLVALHLLGLVCCRVDSVVHGAGRLSVFWWPISRRNGVSWLLVSLLLDTMADVLVF